MASVGGAKKDIGDLEGLSNTYCSALWNHQFVDPVGRIKPCCRFDGNEFPIEHNIADHRIQDTFHSDFQNSLREQASRGERIAGCVRCYQEEDAGKKSLRQRLNSHKTNQNLTKPVINFLELSLSNDCNLMCRMCDSRYSRKLFDEEVEYRGKARAKQKYMNISLDEIYELLPTITYLKFTGGEPMLIKAHWDLLEYAVEHDYAKNITLNYSTNATVYPKPKIVDTWSAFDSVEIALSLDSIDADENEYLRHGTKQQSVLVNIDKYCSIRDNVNLQLMCRPTITIYNAYHLPETIEYLNERDIKCNPTHLTFPEQLSLTTLPAPYKKVINDKLENYNYKNEEVRTACGYILAHMNSTDDSGKWWEETLRYTKFLDNSRGQDFLTVCSYYKEPQHG